MSTKNGTVANGVATKNNLSEKAPILNNQNGKEQPKIEGSANPVEKQRERSQKLVDLFEKEAKLLDSRDTLKSFRLASDENTNELTLRDGKGTQFRTCNALAIGEVLDMVKKTIDTKLAEVQAQIIAA